MGEARTQLQPSASATTFQFGKDLKLNMSQMSDHRPWPSGYLAHSASAAVSTYVRARDVRGVCMQKCRGRCIRCAGVATVKLGLGRPPVVGLHRLGVLRAHRLIPKSEVNISDRYIGSAWRT